MVNQGSEQFDGADSSSHTKTSALDHQTRKEFLLSALDRYESRLTAYANRLLYGDLDRARDVVQFTFLKLCQQRIDKVQHKLAAWLYTVVRNRIVDDARSAKSSNLSLDFDCRDEKSDDPAEHAERIEFLKKLRRLMIDLPDSQREVIDLWSHGFSSQEISDITNLTPGTVRVTLHRGLKTLKQHPQVAQWLANESTQKATETGERKKPSRATGFSANPVDPGLTRSTPTSVENQVEPHINGNPNPKVSMPGRLS